MPYLIFCRVHLSLKYVLTLLYFSLFQLGFSLMTQKEASSVSQSKRKAIKKLFAKFEDQVEGKRNV